MHPAVAVVLSATVTILVTAQSTSARTFTIKNNCTFSLDTHIVSNPSGRWNAAPGSTNQFQVDNFSSARVWAIPPGGPAVPATQFELHTDDTTDYYGIVSESLVGGFNLPMFVTGCGDSRSCPDNLNANCPENMRVQDTNGNTVACRNQDDCNYFKSGCPEASPCGADSAMHVCPSEKHSDYSVQFC